MATPKAVLVTDAEELDMRPVIVLCAGDVTDSTEELEIRELVVELRSLVEIFADEEALE